jgi:hypothetical protein
MKNQPFFSSLLVFIRHDPEEGSNVRWWYLGSNKNMLYAFGGADLDVTGCAKFSGDTWSGDFHVTLRDEYEYAKSGIGGGIKQFISEAASRSYTAGVYLERVCGQKTFWNDVKLKMKCSGEC